MCTDALGCGLNGLCTDALDCEPRGLCAGALGCSAGGSGIDACSLGTLLGGRCDATVVAMLLAGRTEGGGALGDPSRLSVLAGRAEGGGGALGDPSRLNVLAERTEGGGALGALGRGGLLAIRADGGASPGILLAECGALKPVLRAGAFDFSGAALGEDLSRALSFAGATLGCGTPGRVSTDVDSCCGEAAGSVAATGGGVFDRWGGLGGTILRKPGRIAGGGWEGAGTDGRCDRGATWG